jgi:hypothetical protein
MLTVESLRSRSGPGFEIEQHLPWFQWGLLFVACCWGALDEQQILFDIASIALPLLPCMSTPLRAAWCTGVLKSGPAGILFPNWYRYNKVLANQKENYNPLRLSFLVSMLRIGS